MMCRYRVCVGLLAGALGAFALLSVLVFAAGWTEWDAALLAAAGGLRAPGLDRLMLYVTGLGAWMVIAPVTVAAFVALLAVRRRAAAALLGAAVAGAEVLQVTLKAVFARPRPEVIVPLQEATSASYPSGHAMVSCALALALCVVLWRTRGRAAAAGVAAAYVLIVGFSRVYLGMHHPSDVLAGWSIAVAWVAAVGLVIDVWRARRGSGA